jgi:hypothetical protein
METEYLYTKEQAAELRKKIIRDEIERQVKAAFKKYDRLQSAMFAIAQFWADEANDAVHYELIFSILETPVFPNGIEDDYYESDLVNLPELPSSQGILAFVENPYWDDNGEAIPAFAAFCKEDSHQEMDGLEAFTPYAVFRRKGENIEMEIVGEMLRPWLDGVKPEDWEDE